MGKALQEKARAKFNKIWHRVDCLFNLYAKKKGLNFTSLMILEFIYDAHIAQEIYTQKDICENLALPKQLVNSAVTSFWEQGYVELKEAKDRRNKNIFLTEKGKEYTTGIVSSLDALESKTWESFEDEEIIAFVNSMEKYEKAFEETINNM